jgi:hypothetical protein
MPLAACGTAVNNSPSPSGPVDKLGCYTRTPAAFGSIVLTVRNAHVQTGEGEPCAEANRLGAALLRSLP